MKRRVLLLSFYLDLGGTERQLTELARSLDPAKYDVHVGCGSPGGLRFQELRSWGIPVVAFPMPSFFSMSALRQAARLMAYLRNNHIDLIHAFDVPMDVFAVPAAWLGRGFHRRPVILSSQRADRRLTTGARLPVLRLTDRIVDGVVVNCEYIRGHLIHDEHVAPDKIHLCYNGLDLSLFPFREARGRTFGCVSALRAEKNLALLLRAFASLHREHAYTRLLIVGSGPLQSELEALVTNIGMTEAITFVPATRDVAHWLHQIDIFVLPSTTEALSNSIMEAMACGCAVIASNVGGNPELIVEGERGLLFPSGDVDALSIAMLRLLCDLELRIHLAHAARAFVESHLTIQASVARMGAIYDGFLTSSE